MTDSGCYAAADGVVSNVIRRSALRSPGRINSCRPTNSCCSIDCECSPGASISLRLRRSVPVTASRAPTPWIWWASRRQVDGDRRSISTWDALSVAGNLRQYGEERLDERGTTEAFETPT